MVQALRRAPEPIERGGSLFTPAGCPDQLALDAVALGQKRLELLCRAAPREGCRIPPLLGGRSAVVDGCQLELRDPRPHGADVGPQLFGAFGGCRLERKRPQTLLHLGLEVARTLDVRCDPGKLELGAVASPLEAPEPGCLLDELPAFLGL